MDGTDGLDLTERLVTPLEMAEIMGVEEADVLAWIDSGELEVQRGEDGEPRVPIREHREVGRSADGAAGIETGLTFYSGPRDRQLLVDARAERRARERDARIAAAAGTGVDIYALTAALAERLAAVAPPGVRIATTERGMVDVLDVRGGGAGVDVLLAVAGYEGVSRSAAERVVGAGWCLLETAQDEIAEVTTEPWPQQGFWDHAAAPRPALPRRRDRPAFLRRGRQPDTRACSPSDHRRPPPVIAAAGPRGVVLDPGNRVGLGPLAPERGRSVATRLHAYADRLARQVMPPENSLVASTQALLRSLATTLQRNCRF